MLGVWVSLTMTSKLQVATLQSLEAEQLTVLVPTGNEYGDVITVTPILHTTVGVGMPVEPTSNDTLLEHRP